MPAPLRPDIAAENQQIVDLLTIAGAVNGAG